MTLPGRSALQWAAVAMVLWVAWNVARVLLLGPPEPVPPARDSLLQVSLSLPQPPSAEDAAASDFVQRPLFWASRRPPPDEADQTVVTRVDPADTEPPLTAEARALDKARVVGTYALADGSGGAIVLSEGARHRVAVGETLLGWTLERVDEQGVVFSGTVRVGRAPEQKRLALEHAGVGKQ